MCVFHGLIYFLFQHVSASVLRDVNKLACYQNGNEETSGDSSSSSQARKTNTIRSLRLLSSFHFLSSLCLASAPSLPPVGFMVVCRLSGALIYCHTGVIIPSHNLTGRARRGQ